MRRIFMLLSFLILFITGCVNVKVMEQESLFIREVIETLTSDEMRGRLTGTEGNDLAVEFLESHFKELGLEPLEHGSFLLEYSHQFYDPDQTQFEMKVHLENGEAKEFIRGLDYLERPGFTSYEATYPLAFDINDPNLSNTFFVAKDSKDFEKYYDKVQGVLIVEDLFRKTLTVDGPDKPIVQISKSTYEYLKNQPNGRLSILSRMNQEMIQAFNVVGRIPGKDRSNAVILSAHFDHVGWVGETIYRGAIDNASGVAVLLDIAQKLKDHSESSGLFEKDIIIVGLNGEESGLQGSYHFVESVIKEYEHIYNINLDSIYDAPLELHSGDEYAIRELIEDIEHYFGQVYLPIKTDLSLGVTSDHASFLFQHINAVSIGSQNIRGKIHHPFDTIDQINHGFLNDVSEGLFQFLVQHDHKVYEHIHLPSETVTDDSEVLTPEEKRRIDEMIDSQKKMLKFDEYKLIEIMDNEFWLVTNDRFSFDTINDLKNYYPGISVMSKIGEYEIDSIKVLDINDARLDASEMEPNKIYKIERLSENIYILGLKYSMLKNNEKYVLDISISKDEERAGDHDHGEDDQATVKDLLINGESFELNYYDQTLYSFEYRREVNGQSYTISIARGNEVMGEIDGVQSLGIKTDLTEEAVKELILTNELDKIVDEILLSF